MSLGSRLFFTSRRRVQNAKSSKNFMHDEERGGDSYHAITTKKRKASRARSKVWDHFTKFINDKDMDLRESIRNQVDVSLMLAKHVFSTRVKGGSNLVFSPLSINVILGLIATGSKGPTLNQLLAFLKSKSTDDFNTFASQIITVIFADGSPSGGPRMSVANGAWIQQTLHLKPSFKHVADTVYKTVCESVDFKHKAIEVANQVNLWAEKETGGLIKQILPPGVVRKKTKLILANAMYFKGAWTQKFNASETEDQEFHLLDGSSVQVPFMSSKKKQYVEVFDGFKVLELPYKQGEDKRHFSMYFFLPDAKDGLSSLMDKVNSEFSFLEHHLPNHPVAMGEFRIPKFKISFDFEASRVLKEFGLVLPFVGKALTEIVDSPQGLYVSKNFHKSFIEVNEEGTKAAAVTASEQRFGCSMMQLRDKVNFVADHPFLFFIREDLSGVILFIGTVLNPLSD